MTDRQDQQNRGYVSTTRRFLMKTLLLEFVSPTPCRCNIVGDPCAEDMGSSRTTRSMWADGVDQSSRAASPGSLAFSG